jgi:N utilization substance protein B
MLNRRHLRIKTLQYVYAFHQSKSDNLAAGEKNLLKSIQKIYELYIHQLSLLVEVVDFATHRMEEAKKKFFPSEEDLSPNTRFINNRLMRQLSENIDFRKKRDYYKVNWSGELNLLLKIYNLLKETPEYQAYMAKEKAGYKDDREILIFLVSSILSQLEILQNIYEDRDIFWSEADFDISLIMVLKTLQQFGPNTTIETRLPGIYKLEGADNEDREFMIRLFRKTIIKDEELGEMVEAQAKNWEAERIALMDMLIMKMALAELLEFQSIPVKVSINEYIELAKLFSSKKSKVFVNGILDKLIIKLKEEKKIVKTGRGLVDY